MWDIALIYLVYIPRTSILGQTLPDLPSSRRTAATRRHPGRANGLKIRGQRTRSEHPMENIVEIPIKYLAISWTVTVY